MQHFLDMFRKTDKFSVFWVYRNKWSRAGENRDIFIKIDLGNCRTLKKVNFLHKRSKTHLDCYS